MPSSGSTREAPGGGAPPASGDTVRWLTPLFVLMVGMFISLLDMSIVNVAIPRMQNSFGAATQDIQWVTTAYNLVLGIVVPASAWLGDRVGLGRVYVYCLVAFSVASLLCGTAWDLNSLIAFRVLQAVPGGVIPVVSLTMLYRIVPPGRIGTAMGIYGLGLVFAPASGPPLGGYLVEYLDWRLVFLINVPIGLIGTLWAVRALPPFPPTPTSRFDGWGFLTVSTGLFAVLLALSEGEFWGWGSYRILLLFTGGVLALALFVVIELEVEHPLLEPRILRSWLFTNSLFVVTALQVGLSAMLFYLPLYLQEDMHITPLRTGLLLLPEALVMGAVMPLAGRVQDLLGPRWPATIGLAIAAYGTLLLCRIGPDMSDLDIVWWTGIRGLGNGMALMPIMTAGLSVVPPALVGGASAVNNVVQRVSTSLCLAAFTALSSSQQAQLTADRGALLGGSTAGRPGLAPMIDQGAAGLYPLWSQLRVHVTAAAYSDIFLITALVTATGAALSLMFRTARPAEPAEPDHGTTPDHGTPEPAAPSPPHPEPAPSRVRRRERDSVPAGATGRPAPRDGNRYATTSDRAGG